MLTTYLALGLLAAASPAGPPTSSALVTAGERTFVLSRMGGSANVLQDLDPSDVLDFVVDMSGLLAAGEGIVTRETAVQAAAAALGFEIRQLAPYAPQSVDATKLRVWLAVNVDHQIDPVWQRAQACGFEVTVNTDSVPPRRFQRTCIVQIFQK